MWYVLAIGYVSLLSIRFVSALSKVEGSLVLRWEDEDGKDVAVARVSTVPVFPANQKLQLVSKRNFIHQHNMYKHLVNQGKRMD